MLPIFRLCQPFSRQLQPLRQQLLVDHQVQGVILARMGLYGAACGLYLAVIQFCSQSMLEPEADLARLLVRFLDEAIYWAPGLMLLGPLVVYDLLRVSNRFAGPILRLRRGMNALAEGQDAGPIRFRRDDHWHDLAAVFNRIREEFHLQSEEAERLRRENASLQQTVAELREENLVLRSAAEEEQQPSGDHSASPPAPPAGSPSTAADRPTASPAHAS